MQSNRPPVMACVRRTAMSIRLSISSVLPGPVLFLPCIALRCAFLRWLSVPFPFPRLFHFVLYVTQTGRYLLFTRATKSFSPTRPGSENGPQKERGGRYSFLNHHVFQACIFLSRSCSFYFSSLLLHWFLFTHPFASMTKDCIIFFSRGCHRCNLLFCS
jgi:hypothetical protein